MAKKFGIRWQPKPIEIQLGIEYRANKRQKQAVVTSQRMLLDPNDLAILLTSLKIVRVSFVAYDKPRKPVHQTYEARQRPECIRKNPQTAALVFHDGTHHVVVDTIENSTAHSAVRQHGLAQLIVVVRIHVVGTCRNPRGFASILIDSHGRLLLTLQRSGLSSVTQSLVSATEVTRSLLGTIEVLPDTIDRRTNLAIGNIVNKLQ
ncbi:hypothetical protein WL14_03510 [Burkholderia cepacia]|nr:hypothetical protein WL14_03510 [Burkholderia cepacia]